MMNWGQTVVHLGERVAIEHGNLVQLLDVITDPEAGVRLGDCNDGAGPGLKGTLQ